MDVPKTFKKAHPKSTPIQLDLDWKKTLLLNLKVKPSSLFIKQEGAGEEEGAEVIEMNWLCKEGLPQKINLVKSEFEKERGLRPMKVCILGPPCSGKSFYGDQLAKHYNVPHIHMQKLIEELLQWDHEKDVRY